MKRLLLFLILFLLWGCNQNQLQSRSPNFSYSSLNINSPSTVNGDIILKLDTKGHTGVIRDIIVTNDKDIISASDDKTIRVWSSKTGKEKRKILGEIGRGDDGKIFAIALSPNEEFLAVAGFIKLKREKSDFPYYIRIYKYKTGKLLKILEAHKDTINDLAFSPDGKYLISGSADSTAKIWKVAENFSLKDTINFHNRQLYAVKIIKNGKDYFAITAGYDNRVVLYNMSSKKVKYKKLPYSLKYLATSNRQIAVCGKGNMIQIYDLNLNPKKTILSNTKPSGLAYSSNGRFLVAGTGEYPYYVNVYDVNRDYKPISNFKRHTNLVMAVAFLNNQVVVSGGGNSKEIYLWDKSSKRILKEIVGDGRTVWSVGIDGDKIAWGNRGRRVHNLNSWSVERYIDLKTFNIGRVTNSANFKRISKKRGAYSLEHKEGGVYGHSDATLDIKKNGELITSITRNATNGYRHRCYGFYKDYVVSGGANGSLEIYNLKGKRVANLIGHTGEIWSIAIDGDRLVSGSVDQTIRVWDLSFLKRASSNKKIDRVVYPILNIFVSKDNEWVVWTPSGYYNSSIDGAKYVGFHINRGVHKEAYYVSADKYPNLYRPDIIDAVLKTGSEKRAVALVSKDRKVKAVDIVSTMPPIITLLSPSEITTTKSSVDIKLNIESKSDITKFIVLRNGEKVDTRGVKLKSNIALLRVDLDSGENLISIRVKNKNSISDEVIVRVNRVGYSNKDIYKPTLYLLSIGVSKYKNSSYNLKVADRDAKAISEIFKSQKGKIYKDVIVKELLNKDATTDNILDALDWIEKEVTQRDVAIIFIAGHGENDNKGNYYFLTHDSDVNRLRRTALKWLEIKDTVDNLPSKILLLVDTCHSGNVTGRKRDITGAIKSIVESGAGAVVMSATTGRGYSYERDEWGHGAFTKALIEGLKDAKADYSRDNSVSIKEIDLYITNRVKELTDGKQKPTTKIPDSIPDFPIVVK